MKNARTRILKTCLKEGFIEQKGQILLIFAVIAVASGGIFQYWLLLSSFSVIGYYIFSVLMVYEEGKGFSDEYGYCTGRWDIYKGDV